MLRREARAFRGIGSSCGLLSNSNSPQQARIARVATNWIEERVGHLAWGVVSGILANQQEKNTHIRAPKTLSITMNSDRTKWLLDLVHMKEPKTIR